MGTIGGSHCKGPLRQNVLRRFMIANIDGNLMARAFTAPGHIHGVGHALLVVRCHNEHRLGGTARPRFRDPFS